MNIPNFWYGSCTYGPLRENHTLYADATLYKILMLRNFCHLTLKFDRFLPKLTVLRIFGPPRSGWDLWFSLRSFVRPFVRPFVRSFGRDLKNGS